MADKVLHDRGLITLGQAVCPKLSLLYMRCVHGQDIALIFARRKSCPRVLRIGRRVRAAVHPDRPIRHRGVGAHFDGDQLLGLRIPFFPDAEIPRTVKNIRRHVSHALMLGQSQP